MAPKLFITSAHEYTGFKIAQYILQFLADYPRHRGDETTPLDPVLATGLELFVGLPDGHSTQARVLAQWGAHVVECSASAPWPSQQPPAGETDSVLPAWTGMLSDTLRAMDYVLIVPSAQLNRVGHTLQWMEACRACHVPNILLWSSICNQQTNSKYLSQYRRLELALRELENAHYSPTTTTTTATATTSSSSTHSGPALTRPPLNWAIVRTGWYMEYLYLHQSQIQTQSHLALPIRAGYMAPVRLRDVAIAILKILDQMASFVHTGPGGGGAQSYRRTFNFTGSDLMTGHWMTQVASQTLQKPIEFRHTSLDSTSQFLLDQQHQHLLVRRTPWATKSEHLPKAGAGAVDPQPLTLTVPHCDSDSGSSASSSLSASLSPSVESSPVPIPQRTLPRAVAALGRRQLADNNDAAGLSVTPPSAVLFTARRWLVPTASATSAPTNEVTGGGGSGGDHLLLDLPTDRFSSALASPREGSLLNHLDHHQHPPTHPIKLIGAFDIEFVLEIYEMARRSRFDLITGDLGRVLGREPESLGTFLSKKRSDFLHPFLDAR
ncbi:hypothetical protein H4R33_004687 [Dimargaris cristalligena]|nr:hypothetical protein H4R33_004687 [Dimargaris cristalligena]